jgi:adenosylhomocysteinase
MVGDRALGQDKVAWVRAHMPVLESIRRRFEAEQPFRGHTLSLVLHVESKTAALALALQAGGGSVHVAAGNPLSTDDDAVAALEAAGVPTKARKGETLEEYQAGLRAMLDPDPDILIDDGADLVALAHTARPDRGRIIGSTEETTAGVQRLRAMEKAGALRFPAFVVNDALMKHLFDNRYGTGQSVLDGLFSATNLLLAGRVAVVAGYGWCGKGVAARLRGVGAEVLVTEVDPICGIEARLDGFRVVPMLEAARQADVIVTVTGDRDIVTADHFRVMKDGCLLANAGHFDVEINKVDLAGMSVDRRVVRPHVERFTFADGRNVYLLGEGRLINLASGQGHPAEIMDLSFSLQALTAELIAKHGANYPPGVHRVPNEIDMIVAKAALGPLGVHLDELTPKQVAYMDSWKEGT